MTWLSDRKSRRIYKKKTTEKEKRLLELIEKMSKAKNTREIWENVFL